ncbi:MAG: DUF4296 domain-containing protein [Flavobacteriaceae bacterium]|nr:DUF4296 domain-containing protein [Flavobacteriaceae bacterium]
MKGKRREKREETEDRRLKTVTFTLSFISVLFLLSCQDVKKPEMPTNLISKEKMVDILSDVYISNATRNVNNKLIRQKGLQLDSLIYAKYEIDSLQFVESNGFYSANLKTYGKLLTNVQSRLKKLKIEKDSLYKIAKKEDSILKAKNKKLKIKVFDSIKLLKSN